GPPAVRIGDGLDSLIVRVNERAISLAGDRAPVSREHREVGAVAAEKAHRAVRVLIDAPDPVPAARADEAKDGILSAVADGIVLVLVEPALAFAVVARLKRGHLSIFLLEVVALSLGRPDARRPSAIVLLDAGIGWHRGLCRRGGGLRRRRSGCGRRVLA